ncbi:hypothetical protein BC936DRAFT_138176, partial [Jimgerdemannia flammicorona]
ALYATFTSPWSDTQTTAGLNIEPEYHLPPCYNVQAAPPAQQKIRGFTDETLFYVFYSMPRDVLQEAAAQELYNRNWRYHKDLRLWLTKEEGTEPVQKGPSFERGNYIFFDPSTWEKVKKEYILVYDALEEKPPATPVAAGPGQGVGGLMTPGAGGVAVSAGGLSGLGGVGLLGSGAGPSSLGAAGMSVGGLGGMPTTPGGLGIGVGMGGLGGLGGLVGLGGVSVGGMQHHQQTHF